jgi:hypothetical protein
MSISARKRRPAVQMNLVEQMEPADLEGTSTSEPETYAAAVSSSGSVRLIFSVVPIARRAS